MCLWKIKNKNKHRYQGSQVWLQAIEANGYITNGNFKNWALFCRVKPFLIYGLFL